MYSKVNVSKKLKQPTEDDRREYVPASSSSVCVMSIYELCSLDLRVGKEKAWYKKCRYILILSLKLLDN